MTRIKLCGLTRREDIQAANALRPEYIGFVFTPKSRRYLPPEQAAELKALLSPGIQAVGVFVNETPEAVAALLDQGIIDMAQLHGGENGAYIRRLRELTDKPIIQAFSAEKGLSLAEDSPAENSSADFILIDSGPGGTGEPFDWTLLSGIKRPYFLAGGLTPENAGEAVRRLSPYGVDVSSGIETAGKKDFAKMTAFVFAVRNGRKEETP